MRKVLNWVGNIILIILFVLVILVLFAKYTNSDTILGFIPLKVLSGSMEPDIKTGDLIIVKVEIYNQNGDISFKTKGDANNAEDEDLVMGDDLVGKYIFRIPAFGYLTDLIRQPLGFVLLFVLPIVILLGKEVKSLIKT
mgnify:CR=1 FL=1